MKRFLFGIFFFLIPVATFFVAMEMLVHIVPNSYSYKYNYIKANGHSLEAITLGHSQLYDDFMPDAFRMPSFNLCNSSQFYKEDYYLLCELLPSMPNLKLVILPIGYVNVKESDSDGFNERSTFYYEYMNIDYGNTIPIYNRYECLYPKRAFEKLTSYYLHHIDIIGCDSTGRRSTHNFKKKKKKQVQPNMLPAYTLDTHDKAKMYIWGEDYLTKIGSLLQSKCIKLVLVSPPHYWSCFNSVNKEQKQFLQEKLNSYKLLFSFQYISMEEGKTFIDEDYYDDAHLSEIGAEKFTKMLNDSIKI